MTIHYVRLDKTGYYIVHQDSRTYLLHLDDNRALEILNTKFMKKKLYRIKHLITLADVYKGIKLEDT